MRNIRICPNCEKEFMINRPWQRFCSASCRNNWHNDQRKSIKIMNENKLPNGENKA